MSSLAQEESRSISENVKWGIRKSFADGKVYLPHKGFLGYKYDENKNIIIDKDTEWIVRLIYKEFLSGSTFRQICQLLEGKGLKTPMGKTKWRDTTVRGILRNEKYCVSAILQKIFVEDFLTHSTKVNNGEVPKYYVHDSHPAIITKEDWELVQIELNRRKEMGLPICLRILLAESSYAKTVVRIMERKSGIQVQFTKRKSFNVILSSSISTRLQI